MFSGDETCWWNVLPLHVLPPPSTPWADPGVRTPNCTRPILVLAWVLLIEASPLSSSPVIKPLVAIVRGLFDIDGSCYVVWWAALPWVFHFWASLAPGTSYCLWCLSISPMALATASNCSASYLHTSSYSTFCSRSDCTESESSPGALASSS